MTFLVTLYEKVPDHKIPIKFIFLTKMLMPGGKLYGSTHVLAFWAQKIRNYKSYEWPKVGNDFLVTLLGVTK